MVSDNFLPKILVLAPNTFNYVKYGAIIGGRDTNELISESCVSTR